MSYLEGVGVQEEHTTALVGGDQSPRVMENDKTHWFG